MKKLFVSILAFIMAYMPVSALEYTVKNAVIEDNLFVWEVINIDYRDDCTIVTKQVTPKKDGSYSIASDYNAFLEDFSTKMRFGIKWSAIGFDSKTYLYNNSPYEFTEIYEPIGDADRINIYSGKYYYIKGLDTDPLQTTNPTIRQEYPCGNMCNMTITSVIIAQNMTFVDLEYYSYYDEGWVSFDKNIIIRNVEKNFSASIMMVVYIDENDDFKNMDLSTRYTVQKAARNRFMLVFPGIPSGIFSVDIIEPDGFYWYGIKISNIE